MVSKKHTEAVAEILHQAWVSAETLHGKAAVIDMATSLSVLYRREVKGFEGLRFIQNVVY